jgi:transposase
MSYVKTKQQEMKLRSQQFRLLIESGLSIKEIQVRLNICYSNVNIEYHKYLKTGGTRILKGTHKQFIPDGCSREIPLSYQGKSKKLPNTPEQRKENNRVHRMNTYYRKKGETEKIRKTPW